ncbi:Disks large 5 [Nymphon striatum]|nr:Disks large 5 [Nymphon striatum]
MSSTKLDESQNEAMIIRRQFSDHIADKHRLEQEIINLKKFREDDKREISDLRRQQQVFHLIGTFDPTVLRIVKRVLQGAEGMALLYTGPSLTSFPNDSIFSFGPESESRGRHDNTKHKERIVNGSQHKDYDSSRNTGDPVIMSANDNVTVQAEDTYQPAVIHADVEAMNQSGNNEVVNQMYITAVQKYEAIKEDYDSLQSRYADLIASHSTAVSKLELTQEEVSRLKKNYDEVCQERNVALRERNGLKQQCTAAIRQWDNALRERNEAKESLAKVQQQRDEAMKEINQAMAIRIKASKDITRLTEERNGAVQEYSLIMSERDTVHKEIEKLQEELANANKSLKATEAQNKATLEEVQILRTEIASALHDRDKALKECNDLREKYGEHVKEDLSYDDSRKEWEIQKMKRDVNMKERAEDNLYEDRLGLRQRERLDNLDQANVEIEALTKRMEKLKIELSESQQETDLNKKRRDWAFNERDKIVLERESMRTLCDKLRRERDRAVSDLAEALRDSDDMKKQKNETSKELKELREKMESQLEKESRMKQLNSVSPNHSRDSAIDADMQEWETETLEFDLSAISSDLGFDLAGGKGDPQFPNDFSIYVTNVERESAADKKLKINDVVLRINNIDVTNVERKTAVDAIRNNGDIINMVVRRRKATGSRYIHTVQLHLSPDSDVGITVATGFYISRICPGSVTAREGNIAVGDRLITVNSQSLESMHSSSEVQKLIEESGEIVTLSVLKNMGPAGGAPLSSASSSHNISENLEHFKSNSPRMCTAAQLNGTTTQDAETRISDEASVEESPSMKPISPPVSSLESQRISNSPNVEVSSVSKYRSPEQSAIHDDYSHIRRTSHLSSANYPPAQPSTMLDRAYQRIFREPRSKSRHDPNSLSRQEAEATAALDSVIDHFSQPPELKVPKRRKKRGEKLKNGGTWPKYRGPLIDYCEIGTATVRTPQKKKERKSIHSIASFPKQFSIYDSKGQSVDSTDCSSNGVTHKTSHNHDTYYINYKHNHAPQSSNCSAMNSMPVIRPKSPTYHSSPSYSSPSPSSPIKKTADHIHYSTTSTPATSLDYSVVSAQRDKEVMELYKNKNKPRPKSAHYAISSDSEFSVPMDTSVVGHSKSIVMDNYGKPFPSMQYERLPFYSLGEPVNLPNYSDSQVDRPTPPYVHTSSSNTQPVQSAVMRNNNQAYPMNGQRHAHQHFTPMVGSMSPPPSYSPRYSLPGGLSSSSYTSRSGDNVSPAHGMNDIIDPRRFQRIDSSGQYSVNASPSPSQYSFGTHSPTPSMDLPHFHQNCSKRLMPVHSHSPYREEIATFSPYDGLSTLPKRTHQRIRIPSNHSVTSKSSAGKVSSSSIEKASTISDRGSPLSTMTVEISPDGGSHSSSVCDFRSRKVNPGDVRSIFIDRSAEPLGIQISCGTSGGIFVSSVTENSLASRTGILVGDQLLEVCGINMRSATYQLAASVLRQCGDSITMLVQYNPDSKFSLKHFLNESCQSSDETSPNTPCNSPPNYHHHLSHGDSSGDDMPTSANSTLTRQKAAAILSVHSSSDHRSNRNGPRFVFMKKATSNIGISLIGGNAVGIFVHSIQKDSPAATEEGLKAGDQILEYNGVDLRKATAENAAYELAKPADSVIILVQYNASRYREIQDLQGDSFYVRAMFDHHSESLSFRKDDILFIDNTMFNGVPGLWRAWLVDKEGHKLQCGVIPSKYKAEEELQMRRSMGDLDTSDRRSSSSARRSFFRRKKHQRSSSRDSKELASFSDVSINSFSDSGTLVEEIVPQTYCPVERLDCYVKRPVIIVGPLVEVVCDKLVQDFPHIFARCIPEVMRGSLEEMERGLADSKFIDYRRRGSHFECTTVLAVREICDRNFHCIMDVSLAAVERLHKCYIYPIVIFIKFKSCKQIRQNIRFSRIIYRLRKGYINVFLLLVELKSIHTSYSINWEISCPTPGFPKQVYHGWELRDSRQIKSKQMEVKDQRLEKVTSKLAKEIFDHSVKIETEHKDLFSAVIPGASLAYMCTQVKTCVDQEQIKTLWVPSDELFRNLATNLATSPKLVESSKPPSKINVVQMRSLPRIKMTRMCYAGVTETFKPTLLRIVKWQHKTKADFFGTSSSSGWHAPLNFRHHSSPLNSIRRRSCTIPVFKTSPFLDVFCPIYSWPPSASASSSFPSNNSFWMLSCLTWKKQKLIYWCIKGMEMRPLP